jgi:hypothetical protein
MSGFDPTGFLLKKIELAVIFTVVVIKIIKIGKIF